MLVEVLDRRLWLVIRARTIIYRDPPLVLVEYHYRTTYQTRTGEIAMRFKNANNSGKLQPEWIKMFLAPPLSTVQASS